MSEGRIELRVEAREGGRVAFLTLANPRKLNTLNAALMRELRDALRALAADGELRAAVLRGAGERASFGGADIGEMARLDAGSGRAFITLLHECCEAARRLPVPVVARLQGWVLGGGLELAASCDLRIAGASARFGMPEVRIGIPSVIEAALLPRLIGWGRARRLLLTGETIDAARAEAWGLVEEVVPDAALDQAVERVLADLLAAGPGAVRAQKRLLATWEDAALDAAIAHGVEAFAESCGTEEPRRRMAAFLARTRGPRGA